MTAEAQSGWSPSGEAEEAFFAYLSRCEHEEEVDFEAFCAHRPALASDLQEIKKAWDAIHLQPGAGSGLLSQVLGLDSEGAGEAFLPRHRAPEMIEALSTDRHRYRVLGEIARGGMGIVQQVWDPLLRRMIARKICLAQPTSARERDPSNVALWHLVARFLDEVQITGQLDHPGIVPVHDLGLDDDGNLFFTMRLVRGRELSEIIELAREEREGWSISRALSVLVRVAETVAFAHDRGVLHRDLKPANVMVGEFGEVYVMDWGLAKLLPGSSALASAPQHPEPGREDEPLPLPDSPALTAAGAIIGTPAFMSPEQAAGRFDELSPASDIYAIGGMLYQLLTGRPPYDDRSEASTARDLVQAVQSGPPTPVERLTSKASPELVAICHRAMARDPAARYASCTLLARDLQAYLDGRVVRAHRVGAWVELRKWIGRNRATAAAILAAVVLSLAGAVAVSIVQGRWADRSELASYVAHLEAASAALEIHDVYLARQHLEDAPQSRRGWEWHHLWHRLDQSRRTLNAHEDWTSDVEYSPGGRLLASVGKDGRVRVWNVQGGDLVFDVGVSSVAVHCVRFSPDGHELAAGFQDGFVRRWSLSGGEVLPEIRHSQAPVQAIAYHPSRPVLYSAGDDRDIRVWNLEDLSLSGTWTGHERGVLDLAASPDGRWLASGSFDQRVLLWDTETGERAGSFSNPAKVESVDFSSEGSFLVMSGQEVQVRSIPDGELLARWRGRECGEIWFADLHPDDRRVLASCRDGSLRAWDWEQDRVLSEVHGHAGEVGRATWHPSGRTYASGGLQDGQVKIWQTEARGDLSLRQGHLLWAHSIAFLRDSKRYLTASYQEASVVKTWDSESHKLIEEHVFDDAIQRAVVSPDGRWLAVGLVGAEEARVVDVSTWEEIARFPTKKGRCTTMAFSDDGRRLVTGAEFGAVDVWDLKSRRRLSRTEAHEGWVLDVVVGPESRWVASAGEDGDIAITRPDGTLHRLTGHRDAVTRLALHPEGQILASGSKDWTVRLWDVEAGEAIAVLEGHTQEVHSVAFHPEGHRLATGSEDCTIKIWDVDSKRCLVTLRGHKWRILDLAFTPEGDRLISACRDGQLGVWDTAPPR